MSLNSKLGDIEKQDTRDICLADSATTHTAESEILSEFNPA